MAQPIPSPDLKLSLTKVFIEEGTELLDNSSNPRKSAVERVGRFLFVFGQYRLRSTGATSRKKAAVGVLDLVAKKWRWIGYYGNTFLWPTCFLYDDALYIWAREDWMGHKRGQVSRFDLTLEEWSNARTEGITPKPTLTSGDYVEKHNCFVVFGGTVSSRFPVICSNDVYTLHMPEKRWVQPRVKGRKPDARYSHGSCVHDGAVYYYGGLGGNSNTCTDGLFILRFSPGNAMTWSCIQPRREELFRACNFAFVPFQGKLLMCVTPTARTISGLGLYNPETQELEELDLPATALSTLGLGPSAFVAANGSSVGLLAGQNRVDCFVRISLEK